MSKSQQQDQKKDQKQEPEFLGYNDEGLAVYRIPFGF